MLWASTWLYLATKKGMYRRYIIDEAVSASVAEFSWDLKYPGAQILLSEVRKLMHASNPNSLMHILLSIYILINIDFHCDYD